MNNSIINQNDIMEDREFDEYESFQEQLFIQANGKETWDYKIFWSLGFIVIRCVEG